MKVACTNQSLSNDTLFKILGNLSVGFYLCHSSIVRGKTFETSLYLVKINGFSVFYDSLYIT